MKRLGVLAAVVLSVLPSSALAQDTREPDTLEKKPPPPRTLEELGEPEPGGDLLVPTPPEWRMKYDEARTKLLTGEFADAAARFEELEKTAVNRVDRALAHEHKTLAADWAARGLAFVHKEDLGESNATAKALDKRTTDELVSLYTNAVFYGIGSGVWLGTLTKPTTAAGAILPTIALTGASVGSVIGLDSGRGMRYGVPQSIVTGLYIGLEEGIVWGIYASSKSTSSDTTSSTATLIWGSATVGAVAGGALGSSLGTTPGRSSWVGSVALWTGTVGGLFAGAFASDNKPEQPALIVGGLGLTLGTGLGLATASDVSPSIARVRFLDLGGLSGGLLVGGLYAAATTNGNGHVASGLIGLGAAGGLATAWLLTASMPEDRLRTPDQGAAPPTAFERMRPLLLPANGGAMMGVGGALD
jgi:hypothetical protein